MNGRCDMVAGVGMAVAARAAARRQTVLTMRVDGSVVMVMMGVAAAAGRCDGGAGASAAKPMAHGAWARVDSRAAAAAFTVI